MTAPKEAPSRPKYTRPIELKKRETLLKNIGWGIEAFAWDWLYWNPLKLLPIDTASNVGASLMSTIGPAVSANRTMMRNLRLALPNLSDAEHKEIAKGAWRNLGSLAGELPHFPKMRPYSDSDRIKVVGAEYLDQIQHGDRPAVLIGGHFANWEVLASSICNRPLDCQITYRSANNRFIDRRINRARHAYGINILTPKGAGTRELMRALSKGQSVGLMNDQKFNQGIPVPFFGHDAMTAPGPTKLAMKFNAPLVFMSVRRTGTARYTATVYEPFEPETGPDETTAVYNTVLKINQFIEKLILEAPEQWFWMHNRWPKQAWIDAGV